MIYQERIRTAELRGIEIGRAEGIAQGMAEGMAEGMAQGRAEGIAEGMAQGIAEGRAKVDRQVFTDMIRRMLDEKFPVDLIMRVSGLQLSEIKEIEEQAAD